MIETIKELLLEWWGRNTTTRMPLPTIYTYEVEVDGKIVQIVSTCAVINKGYVWKDRREDLCAFHGKKEISPCQAHQRAEAHQKLLSGLTGAMPGINPWHGPLFVSCPLLA